MTEEQASEEVPKKKSRTDVFNEAGSSRAVASASWTILMAIIGAIMLFVYQIYVGFVYGEGGICDDIANEICSVLINNGIDCFTLYNEYDYHTSAYAYDEQYISESNQP